MEPYPSSRSNDPTRSERIDFLVDALALAQNQIKAPERNREVKVTPRNADKPAYSFKYATLDNIIEAVRAPLTGNGLWFTQILKLDEKTGQYLLDTRLMHSTGQWIASQTPLIWDGSGGNQQFGSALTFMRRYALTSLLGIAAEEDDDANAADGNTINEAKDRGRKPVAPKQDVISSGPQAQTERVKPYQIVPDLVPDGSAVNWMAFGKTLMALIKMSASEAEIQEWRKVNEPNLKSMQDEAPKLFTNLSTAINNLMGEVKKNG